MKKASEICEKKFSYENICGQKKAISILKKFISSKRIPHALLFSGPEGTQKETVAKAFLKHLKCSNKTDEGPCDQCKNCYLFENADHPDVKILEPKGKSRKIPIEDVKSMIWFVQLKAYIGKYKIGLIKDADRLTVESANALLKTLEDPPRNTVFILLTSRKNALLQTIISRCQEIDFFPADDKEVLNYVRKKNIAGDVSDYMITMIANGCVGRINEKAINRYKSDREFAVKAIKYAIAKDISSLLELSDQTYSLIQNYASELKKKIRSESSEEETLDEKEIQAYIEGKVRERLDDYFSILLILMRDAMVYGIMKEKRYLKNTDCIDIISEINKKWDIFDIEKKVNLIEFTRKKLSAYCNQRLVLDAFYLGLVMN